MTRSENGSGRPNGRCSPDPEDAASIVIGLVDGVLPQLLVGGRVLGDAKNMQAKLVSAVRKLLKP